MTRKSSNTHKNAIRLDRRGLLKVGMLGSLGLTLSDVLRLQSASAD